MSCAPEDVSLANLDQVALYTIKAIKRMIKGGSGRIPPKEQLQHLIDVIQFNITHLDLEKTPYFSTIRDYSRLLHDEWASYEEKFDTLLFVVALRLGLEKIWTPHGCKHFKEAYVKEIASSVFPDSDPTFHLKELSQDESLFDYFANRCPYLEKLVMSSCDNENFSMCCKFRNLRVIEVGGGVADKVICNALWNVGSKKSDKILELALTKDSKSWQLSFPHLEVLRFNVLAENRPMRIAIGAAALVIQPKINEVSCENFWGNFEVIMHLLEMEEKHKAGRKVEARPRQLQVNFLNISYVNLVLGDLEKVMRVCPKVTNILLEDTMCIHRDISYITKVIPSYELKTLTLDAIGLNNLELSVLLACMRKLEDLTLNVTPESFKNYNLPKPPYKLHEMKDEEHKRMTMFPPVKKLVIQFVTGSEATELDVVSWVCDINGQSLDMNAEVIIDFLSAFPTATEVHFRDTILLPSTFLVFGCFGGAIAVLSELRHVSIVSCNEDIPRPPLRTSAKDHPDAHTIPSISHYMNVQKMLPDLQEEATFKHLEKLNSLEIDECYLSPEFDQVIKALRLSGVNVSVIYRKHF